MSQEGYDKLVAELKQLVSVERPKASAAIAEARDKGDLSENSEYDAAKEAQAHLEDKINRLKLTIAEAKIIDTKQLSTDSVQIMSKVEMTNMANKAKMTYTIVSESEANLKEGKISIKTPIAQGLLNKKVGEIPQITASCHHEVSVGGNPGGAVVTILEATGPRSIRMSWMKHEVVATSYNREYIAPYLKIYDLNNKRKLINTYYYRPGSYDKY